MHIHPIVTHVGTDGLKVSNPASRLNNPVCMQPRSAKGKKERKEVCKCKCKCKFGGQPAIFCARGGTQSRSSERAYYFYVEGGHAKQQRVGCAGAEELMSILPSLLCNPISIRA